MTSTTSEGATSAAGPYDTRLATRINAGVDERLRLLALVKRKRLSRLLTDLLDEALPSAAELTAQLQGGARRDAH